MLEADDIKHSEMKDKIQEEYFRRLRMILKSKLNGGNTVKAINFESSVNCNIRGRNY